MGKTSNCLYEEVQSCRSVLTSIIGTTTATNIVRVMILSRENWASVVNYVNRILRVYKRDLKATEHEGTLVKLILAQMSNENTNKDQDERNSGDT